MRFPGFEGEWELKKLRDFAPLQRGFDLPVDKILKGKYPVVFSNGILKFHNKYKVKGPGIVTGRSGTIGKVTFVEEDYWPHNTSLWVTAFNDNEPKFIYHYYSKSKLERFGTGSGVPTLNRNDVHIQSDYFPFIDEQRKISRFLSFIDERIQTQSKLIEDFKALSQSLTQQIFARNRTFQNSNEIEWTTKRISEVLTIGSGRDYKHLNTGNIPVFGTGGYMTSVDQFLHDGETVCIGRKGTIDKPMYYNGKIWTVDTLFYTHSFEGVLPKFIFYAFQLINWKVYNEASGVPSLSKSTIEKIEIDIPPMTIQHKIIETLSVVDQKVDNETKILSKMRDQKSYLLKSLFI